MKQFFGMRFAWHGLESCCCSGVSEPASKGLVPMVSELRPQLGCRTKGDVKQLFGMRFACGMGSNPAAVRVFRNRPPKDLRQWFRNYVRS